MLAFFRQQWLGSLLLPSLLAGAVALRTPAAHVPEPYPRYDAAADRSANPRPAAYPPRQVATDAPASPQPAACSTHNLAAGTPEAPRPPAPPHDEAAADTASARPIHLPAPFAPNPDPHADPAILAGSADAPADRPDRAAIDDGPAGPSSPSASHPVSRGEPDPTAAGTHPRPTSADADSPPAPPEDAVRELPDQTPFSPDRPARRPAFTEDTRPGAEPKPDRPAGTPAGGDPAPGFADPFREPHTPGNLTPEPAGLGASGDAAREVIPVPSGIHRSERTLFLTQFDCIEMALKNNTDIILSAFDPELNHYDRQGAYGAFDPTAFGNLTLKDEDRETGNALSGAGVLKDEQTTWTTGLRGLLPLGTTYEFSVFANRQHTNSAFASLNPTWTTAAGFTLRQPVWKNFGLDFNRRAIEIARKNKHASQDRFVTTVLKTVFGVQESYLSLVFTLRDKDVRDKSLKLAEKLLEVNRNKVRVGALAPIEELQAETQVAAQMEGIILAEKAIEDAEDALKRQIRADTGDLADWSVHVYPTDQPVYERIEPVLDEHLKLAFQLRPELSELDKLAEIQDINIMAKENDLDPSVDLQWKYQFNGLQDSVSGSFRHLSSYEYQTYEVAAFVEYPLGTRTARSAVKRAQAERRRVDVQRRALEQTITGEVREAVRAILTAQRRIEASQKASELARRQLEADQKRFELGLSTSFQVLQFQEDLAQAERNETKAIIDYMLARLKLQRANGTLLEKMGVYVR